MVVDDNRWRIDGRRKSYGLGAIADNLTAHEIISGQEDLYYDIRLAAL